MYPLAHIGFTLATARGIEKVMERRGIRKFSGLVDYRLVLVGSVLPDIIDKPLGCIILSETLDNGRIYSHTLLFLLLLFVAGLLLWHKRRYPGFLVLAGGCFVHQILDGMWIWPETALWPVYGWGFSNYRIVGWLANWIYRLEIKPYVLLPEIIGGLVLIFLGAELIHERKIRDFIGSGKLGNGSLKKEQADDVELVQGDKGGCRD